ncbi:hypothetical protein G9A89_007580 [Geosiphon pyriformis]|nr:hypothetical protein G9A89_007580 [Geosiphon pyriformis]
MLRELALLMKRRVSFCNGIHHIADVRFENVKNSGWYQYDELQKTYKARAIAIGSSRPPPKSVMPLSLVDFTVPSIGSALKRCRCSYLWQISLDTITGFTGFYPIAGFTQSIAGFTLDG